MRLAGKCALITGGSTGIGRAIALRFGQEGAQIVIADINDAAGLTTASDASGRFVHCDTSIPSHAEHAVQTCVEAYGGIDILINSAAHLGGPHDVATMSPEEWRSVLSVTLDGVFYCSKYAVEAMLAGKRRGSVIHIASVEGMMGVRSHAAYVSGKSALFGLTKSMAIDYGKHGIRVNAISPGIIDSGRPDVIPLKANPEMMRFWREMTVLDRMGQPEEIAAAALFLASDEASYVTGQNLAVDGGWTIGHMPIPD